MASLRKTLLAGVASLGIAVSGAASAQNVHVMNVAVPGGVVAQIRYTGDVPPQIVIAPAPAAFNAWTPVSSVFGPDSPFAMMDRIAAEMDRRAAAMLRYAETMAERADAGGVYATAADTIPVGTIPVGTSPVGAMPFGGESYSYVATVSGNGLCTQSVRIISRGEGTRPVVERHSSGNCGAAPAIPGRSRVQPAAPVLPAAPKQPDLILTQGTGGHLYAGMVRHVASAR